jgi:hypothetical protein
VKLRRWPLILGSVATVGLIGLCAFLWALHWFLGHDAFDLHSTATMTVADKTTDVHRFLDSRLKCRDVDYSISGDRSGVGPDVWDATIIARVDAADIPPWLDGSMSATAVGGVDAFTWTMRSVTSATAATATMTGHFSELEYRESANHLRRLWVLRRDDGAIIALHDRSDF